MSASDSRDRPGLTLLVQLFGREVLDRLARAGYDDESAIAHVQKAVDLDPENGEFQGQLAQLKMFQRKR